MSPTASLPPTTEFPCLLTIRIPFPTRRLAHTALRALSVDLELSPLVCRSFFLARSNPDTLSTHSTAVNETSSDLETLIAGENKEESILVTHYSATTNRMLRVAVNGFFESIGVVVACMRELDVDVVGDEWIGDGMVEVDDLRRVQGLQETGVIG